MATKSKPQSPSRSSLNLVRLNKFIADAGITSRRKAEELIENGSVKINGKVCTQLAVKVDVKVDKVQVKGKLINPDLKRRVYYLFNKPKQVLTAMSDDKERITVADYFKKIKTTLHPVGRLDWDSEGLLLMTNDGDFTQEVIHPRSEIIKTYIVKVDGKPTNEQLEKLKTGVSIIGGKARASHISRHKRGSSQKYDWIKISITEGRNRQVRKMFEKIGFDVLKLQRVAIGGLPLGSTKSGQYRELKSEELLKIFNKKPEKKDKTIKTTDSVDKKESTERPERSTKRSSFKKDSKPRSSSSTKKYSKTADSTKGSKPRKKTSRTSSSSKAYTSTKNSTNKKTSRTTKPIRKKGR